MPPVDEPGFENRFVLKARFTAVIPSRSSLAAFRPMRSLKNVSNLTKALSLSLAVVELRASDITLRQSSYVESFAIWAAPALDAVAGGAVTAAGDVTPAAAGVGIFVSIYIC